MPLPVALELALTGDPIDAERAYDLGIVNRVVPGEQLLEAAMALAERIVANAPLAVRASKRVMRQAFELNEEDAWPINTAAFGVIGSSADALEGAVAFAEKRPPVWRGE